MLRRPSPHDCGRRASLVGGEELAVRRLVRRGLVEQPLPERGDRAEELVALDRVDVALVFDRDAAGRRPHVAERGGIGTGRGVSADVEVARSADEERRGVGCGREVQSHAVSFTG